LQADVLRPGRATRRRALAKRPAHRLLLAGLEWSPEDRRPALERRGLEWLADWEVEQLASRGLGPEAIVDELLAIEVEMWRHVAGFDA
jgi:hypothetical protein